MTAQVLLYNETYVKCVISDLLMIWWTTTVVGAASLVEVSKVCNNWFNVQSCDILSALWLATVHMISNNYVIINIINKLSKRIKTCDIYNSASRIIIKHIFIVLTDIGFVYVCSYCYLYILIRIHFTLMICVVSFFMCVRVHVCVCVYMYV